MAKLKAVNIDDYIRGLETIYSDGIDSVAGQMLYGGAKVMADEIKAEIESIPNKSGDEPYNGLLETQKQGLIDGLGISHKSVDDGIHNVKIGFNGYNALKTKKYPKGEPNAMIARSLIKGTSFRKKNNFIQRAVKRAKAKAEAEMVSVFEKQFNK